MTRFRYGASFVDRATGIRFEAHHPASRPDLWRAYLDGLVKEYSRYGINGLVDRSSLESGAGVSLFFVGLDPDGKVVTGVRCHGPLDDADGAQALAELAASPEIDHHRATLGAVSRYGVVEIKGAWRELSGNGNPLVVEALVRCCAHSLEWLGAEVLLAAVADRMEPVMASVGSLMMGSESAPFPSDRYRTILTGMRRARYRDLLDDAQSRLLREDTEQLRRPPRGLSTTGWRPIVLDVRSRADRRILANLRGDETVRFVDVADRQREELDSLLPAPDRGLLDEPLVHVYYPWRTTLVRMLGPLAFARVRLDRNRHRITEEEQARLRRQRVGVVGLSAGHSAATTLALEGLCGELRLADFDDVELTNLNRLPAAVLDIGINKALVAARRVAEIDPYLPVQVVPRGLRMEDADEFVAGLDVLVEECDDLALKLRVREVARRQHVAVVMETSDRGMLDVERFDEEPDRPILHGLLGDIDAASLESLSVSEKIPYVLAIIDAPQVSARGAASLAEIGRTLSTWPQLGSDVTLGGATIAAAVRRIGRGEHLPSGRTRIDLDSLLTSLEAPGGATARGATARGATGGGGGDERAAGHTGAAVPAAPSPGSPGTGTTAAAETARRARSLLDPMLAIAHAAALAPSGGNVQPWRFELSRHELAIELDRSKGSAMDVRSRASYVALGAAIFNARVAAAAASRLGDVTLFPDGPSSDVVATLELGGRADPDLADLHGPMLERCSNRRRGTPAPLDLDVVGQLTRAAGLEGATLHLVTDRERLRSCADVLAETDRIHFLTPELLEQTVREIRMPGEDVTTGIDVATLELAPSEISSLELMRRRDAIELLAGWDAGAALGDYLKSAVLSSSALAVVTVETSSPASYVTGGAALERVWIEAQRSGLAVQAIGPAFLFAIQQRDFDSLGGARWSSALRALSEQFRDLVGLGQPTVAILVLRLSHAPAPTTRSRRLPIEEVLGRVGAPASVPA